MNKVNLLDEKYKQTNTGTFFAAKEIGDSMQGVYVDKTKRQGKFGWNDYYVIRTDDGDYLIRDFPTIRDHMESMKKGTLVAFKYIGEKTPKDPGKKPYKDIEVFYDRKIVDKEWLAENEEADTEAQFASDKKVDEDNDVPFKSGETTVEQPALEVDPSVTTETPAKEEGPTTDKKSLIVELAKKKFSVSTDKEALDTVMTETGLAIVEKNYDTILDLLQ